MGRGGSGFLGRVRIGRIMGEDWADFEGFVAVFMGVDMFGRLERGLDKGRKGVGGRKEL